jgi:hypothetical protein
MSTQEVEELRADAQDRAERGFADRRVTAKWPLALAAAAVAGIAFWFWSARLQTPTIPAPPAPRSAAPVSAPPPAASGAAHPLGTSNEAPMTASEIGPALVQLLGAPAVRTFLQLGDFPRRLVATIDNMGRSHAPASVWPVQPTAGRFVVASGPEGKVIAASNAERYRPFVRMVDSVDAKQAAALYLRIYPLLQQAYRELGFGDRYFNDRVIEVVDLLLAAPEPARPPRLELVEVKGPVQPVRPWVHYRYVDPDLEALTAGQKILVRVGVSNERRLKRKLADIRKLIAPAGEGTATR